MYKHASFGLVEGSAELGCSWLSPQRDEFTTTDMQAPYCPYCCCDSRSNMLEACSARMQKSATNLTKATFWKVTVINRLSVPLRWMESGLSPRLLPTAQVLRFCGPSAQVLSYEARRPRFFPKKGFWISIISLWKRSPDMSCVERSNEHGTKGSLFWKCSRASESAAIYECPRSDRRPQTSVELKKPAAGPRFRLSHGSSKDSSSSLEACRYGPLCRVQVPNT